MFHEELLVTQVFRVLNVAVFLGAVIYQIRKHMGSLRAAVAQEHQQEAELKTEGKILDTVVNTMHNEAELQQQWLSRMESNIVQWEKAVQLKYEQEQKEYEQRLDVLKEKTKIQYQSLKLLQAEHSVMPAVITKVQDQLVEKMKNEQGKRYVQQLIAFFKKAPHES